MGDAEEALKRKYELLRQKRLAKQNQGQDKSGEGSSSGVPGAVSTTGPPKRPVAREEEHDKESEHEPVAVSAASLDRATIEAIKTTTQRSRAPLGGLGNQGPSNPNKKQKISSLPFVPKRQAVTSADELQDGDERSSGESSGLGGAGSKRSLSSVSKEESEHKIDGFHKPVYEALERIFTETDLKREDVEERALSALRALPQSDALQALSQFFNEDMSRIRNKGAYLWGIVRNHREGRSKSSYSAPSIHSTDFSAHIDSSTQFKLLWPEEERVLSELGLSEGKTIEKEFKFDTHDCSLPPVESLFCEDLYPDGDMDKLKAQLVKLKEHTKNIDTSTWSKLLSQVNLTGRVMQHIRMSCKPELFGWHWAQLYELFVAYPVIPDQCLKEEKIRSLHLSECTGATVCAFNHFLKSCHNNLAWDWMAHSATPEKTQGGPDTKSLKAEEDRFVKETKDKWYFGADGTGKILNQDNVESFWKVAKEKGMLDVITADSATGTSARPQQPDDNETMTQLLLCQTVASMGALASGGTYILRAWSLLEYSCIGLLYLLNSTFEEVVVSRPATVESSTTELFIVCLGFKGISESHLQCLLQACGPIGPAKDGNSLAMIPKSVISPTWFSQLRSCVELMNRLQRAAIERHLRLFHDLPQTERTEIYSVRDRVAQHWKLRFELKPLTSIQDRIVKDGTSVAALLPSSSSSGGKIWYSIRGRYARKEEASDSKEGTGNGLRLEAS